MASAGKGASEDLGRCNDVRPQITSDRDSTHVIGTRIFTHSYGQLDYDFSDLM